MSKSQEIEKACVESEMSNLIMHKTDFVNPKDWPLVVKHNPLVGIDPNVPSLGSHVLMKYFTRRVYHSMFRNVMSPCRLILVSPSFKQISDAWDFLVANNIDPNLEMIILAKYSALDYSTRLQPDVNAACYNWFINHFDLINNRYFGESVYDPSNITAYAGFLRTKERFVYCMSVHVMYFVPISLVSKWFDVNPNLKMLSILNLPIEIMTDAKTPIVYTNRENGYLLRMGPETITFQGLNKLTESGEKVYPHSQADLQNWRVYNYTQYPSLSLINSEQVSEGVTKLILTLRQSTSVLVSNAFLSTTKYTLKYIGDIIVPKTTVDRVRSLVRTLNLDEDLKKTGNVQNQVLLILQGVQSREAALQLFSFDTVAYIQGVPHLILPQIIDLELRNVFKPSLLSRVMNYFVKEKIVEFDYLQFTNTSEMNGMSAKFIALALLGLVGFAYHKMQIEALYENHFAWLYHKNASIHVRIQSGNQDWFFNPVLGLENIKIKTEVLEMFKLTTLFTLTQNFPFKTKLKDIFRTRELADVTIRLPTATFTARAYLPAKSLVELTYGGEKVASIATTSLIDVEDHYWLDATKHGIALYSRAGFDANREKFQTVRVAQSISKSKKEDSQVGEGKTLNRNEGCTATPIMDVEPPRQAGERADISLKRNKILLEGTFLVENLPQPREPSWNNPKEVNPTPHDGKLKNLAVVAAALNIALVDKVKGFAYLGFGANSTALDLIIKTLPGLKLWFFELEGFAAKMKALGYSDVYDQSEYHKLLEDEDVVNGDVFILSDIYTEDGKHVIEEFENLAQNTIMHKAYIDEVHGRVVYAPPFGRVIGGVPAEFYVLNRELDEEHKGVFSDLLKFYPRYCTKYPFPTAEYGCLSCFRLKHLINYKFKCEHKTYIEHNEHKGVIVEDFFGPFIKDEFVEKIEGKHFYFQGPPGCGKTKSIILANVKKFLKEDRQVYVLSPVSRILDNMQLPQGTNVMTTQIFAQNKVIKDVTQNDVLIVDEVFALSTKELHALIDGPWKRVLLFGDPLQVNAIHELGDVKKDAVKQKSHIPKRFYRYYRMYSFTVPHKHIVGLRTLITDPSYYDTVFTKNPKYGEFQVKEVKMPWYNHYKNRTLALAAHDYSLKPSLHMTFNNLGLLASHKLDSPDNIVLTAHSSLGMRSSFASYSITRNRIEQSGHLYVAATRATERFELNLFSNEQNMLLSDKLGMFVEFCLAPIFENLSASGTNTFAVQAMAERSTLQIAPAVCLKYLCFLTYENVNFLPGVFAHAIHNIAFRSLPERTFRIVSFVIHILTLKYAIKNKKNFLSSFIRYGMLIFLKEIFRSKYTYVPYIVATLMNSLIYDQDLRNFGKTKNPIFLAKMLWSIITNFAISTQDVDINVELSPLLERMAEGNTLPIFKLNSNLEQIPDFVTRFVKDPTLFRKALNMYYATSQVKEVYTKCNIPFKNRVVDERINTTNPFKIANVDHYQTDGTFINKSKDEHGNTGRFVYPKTNIHIFQKPILNAISNFGGKNSVHKYHVKKPLRTLKEVDLVTLKSLVQVYHETAQVGDTYDEPVAVNELANNLANVKVSHHAIKVNFKDYWSFTDAQFGVYQSTSLGWQLATLLGRFAQPPRPGMTTDQMLKNIFMYFGSDFEPSNPEKLAQSAFKVIYKQPSDVVDLADLAIINQFNVFIKQTAKTGGTMRIGEPSLLNNFHPTFQSYICKKQHKLEEPSIDEHVRSAGNKVKGGQPVNSTDALVSLLLGTIVRCMTYFLRNCVQENFCFLCGDELSPELAEEIYLRYHEPGKRYKASDVKSMDTIHSPYTYKFFSALMALFMENVFHVEFDFMNIFMQLVPTWFTKSMNLGLKARANYFLSSGLPWTLMLNTVTCLYISGLQLEYSDIIFGMYTGDDSLEQIRDGAKPETKLLINLGITTKLKYTTNYGEFIHRIFIEGEGAGMYNILTRHAAKFCSKRFQPHKFLKDSADKVEVEEYHKGFKETLRRDLSVERFHKTIAANVIYHGGGSESIIFTIANILNMVCTTDSKKLASMLRKKKSTRLDANYLSGPYFEKFLQISSDLFYSMFNTKRISTPMAKDERENVIRISEIQTQISQSSSESERTIGRKRDILYCVPRLFSKFSIFIENKVYSFVDLEQLAVELNANIYISDSTTSHSIMTAGAQVDWALTCSDDHKHAISLTRLKISGDNDMNIDDLALASQAFRSRRGARGSTKPEVIVRVEENTREKPKKGVAMHFQERRTNRKTERFLADNQGKYLAKPKIKKSVSGFKKAVGGSRETARFLNFILNPNESVSPAFLPDAYSAVPFADHKAVSNEIINPTIVGPRAYSKLVQSDAPYAHYFVNIPGGNWGGDHVFNVLNLKNDGDNNNLVVPGGDYSNRNEFEDTYKSAINAGVDVAYTPHTAIALSSADTTIINPVMLDDDQLFTASGTATQSAWFSYAGGVGNPDVMNVTLELRKTALGTEDFAIIFNCVLYDGSNFTEDVPVTLSSTSFSSLQFESITLIGNLASPVEGSYVVGYNKMTLAAGFNGTLNSLRVDHLASSGGTFNGAFVTLSRLSSKPIVSLNALTPIVTQYRPVASSMLITSTSNTFSENGAVYGLQVDTGSTLSDADVNFGLIKNTPDLFLDKFAKGFYSAPIKMLGRKNGYIAVEETFPFYAGSYNVTYVVANNPEAIGAELQFRAQFCTWFQFKVKPTQQIKRVHTITPNAMLSDAVISSVNGKKFMCENPEHLAMIAKALKAALPIGADLLDTTGNKYASAGATLLRGAGKLFA